MKYKKVTLHFEEKRQKYKFVAQYQVFTIIQLNYLCFFRCLAHIYMIRCKNRLESLTKKEGGIF